jgi:hypothetical protein
MSSYTIECRNKTASELEPLQPNGDWNTRLQEFVEMEEGDTLICRNAFVDTRGIQGQKIVVEEDTTLTLEFVHYNAVPFITDQGVTSPDYPTYEPLNSASAWPTDKFVGDDKVYVRCEEIAGAADFFYLKELSYTDEVVVEGCGGFNVVVRYRDTANVEQDKLVYLKEHKVFGGIHTAFVGEIIKGTTFDVYVANSDGTPNLSENMRISPPFYHNTVLQDSPPTPVGVNGIFKPKVFSEDILILKGNYEAADLASRINRAFTEIQGTVTATDLTGTTTVLQEVNAADRFIETTTGDTVAVKGFKFNLTDNTPLTGASQIVLDYDIAASRFNWEFLHTPLYQSKNISVGLINQPSGDVYRVDRYSGIMITNLLASSKEFPNNTNTFWEDKLGFVGFNETVGLRWVLSAQTGANAHTVGTLPASVPIFNELPKLGVEMTGGFQGVDTVVAKETNSYFAAPKFTGTGTIFATTDDTVPVYALQSVLSDDTTVAFGYFLVSVKAQFSNNFITPVDNKGDIVSIVSRYYAKDNYTSASSADTIVYQHKGSPVLLSSFNCRILDSDGKLAKNIGGDNTLFLELVKGDPESKVKTVKKE